MPSIPVDARYGAQLTVQLGQQATVTISGQWQYDPHANPCGASGNGVISPQMPVAGAPQGCCYWSIAPLAGEPNEPQDVIGWFDNNNQTIAFGGTSPGDGNYFFRCNDNRPADNRGALLLTYDLAPHYEKKLKYPPLSHPKGEKK